MPTNLSWNIFPLLNQASTNDADRPGTLLLEPWEVEVTLTSNAGDVEVPTTLDKVFGIISLQYCDEFNAGDYINNVSTDAEISNGTVTVRVITNSITDGAHKIRGMFIGTKTPSVLINTPTE